MHNSETKTTVFHRLRVKPHCFGEIFSGIQQVQETYGFWITENNKQAVQLKRKTANPLLRWFLRQFVFAIQSGTVSHTPGNTTEKIISLKPKIKIRRAPTAKRRRY